MGTYRYQQEVRLRGQLLQAAEREGDMAVVDDDAEDADADQQMVEADQSSESEAEEDGFERESI